jgi:hypothetical protein
MSDDEDHFAGVVDDWPNAGKPLLLRMSKREREMLDYLRERHRKRTAFSMTYSTLLRAMIQASYRRAKEFEERRRTPSLEDCL